MAKKNIYAAVFENGDIKYFNNWPQCQAEVSGKPNVHFKGFASKAEAQSWLQNFAPKAERKKDSVEIYVDGSFSPSCEKAGWGWVAHQNGEWIAEDYGVTKTPALSRNIDGELVAAIKAIEWAKEKGLSAVIFHDYAGIHEWARGTWKAKSVIANGYIDALARLNYPVEFEKVAGHSGNSWNDRADELAKKAIEEYLKASPLN